MPRSVSRRKESKGVRPPRSGVPGPLPCPAHRGPLGPCHRGPEPISPDRSTLGPLKDAPRCCPRATCKPSGKVDSGPGGQPRRGRKGWGCLAKPLPLPGEPGQAHPASLSCALTRPALAGPWALSSGLPMGHWCPVLEARPQESACQEPGGVSPGGGRAGVLGGKHRPPALVLTPHLGNGDSVLAARGFRGPLPLNIQHTPTARGLGPEPAPLGPRPVAGLPRPPLPTAAPQPGGSAAVQKPAPQTQTSLLTWRAPRCLPWGRQTRKPPSPR